MSGSSARPKRGAKPSGRPRNSTPRESGAGIGDSQLSKNNNPMLVATVVVALVALAACVAGIANDFTQDDLSIIRGSTRLHGFAEWRAMLTMPYWEFPAAPDLYRPLTSLFLAAQYVAGFGTTEVFRVTSYICYAVASVGVLRLASRILPTSVAIVVALLFAAHPVHVEAIALAVAQNEILVAVLATVMVVRFLDRRRNADTPILQRSEWVVIATCYALGGLLKEQGLLLPAFPLLAEACFVERPSIRARVRELWKGYAILAGIGVAVLVARTAVLNGRVGPQMIAEALRGQTISGRTLTMLHVVPEWFRLLLWPAHLRAEYSPQEFIASTGFGVHEALGLALIFAAMACAWLARRRAPTVTFGLLWCAVALLPVSNVLIPTGILIAERTLFLASVGFVLAIGGAAAYAHDALIETRWHAPRTRLLIGVAAGGIVLAGIVQSDIRELVWRNSDTLTLASMKDAPRSWRVQQAFAEMMFEQQRVPDGIVASEDAIALAPEPWHPRNRFAQQLRSIGADSLALQQLRLSLAQQPNQPDAIAQLTTTLIAVGRYQEAMHMADSIIVAENAPPVMVQLRHLADSAIAIHAPPGSVKVRM